MIWINSISPSLNTESEILLPYKWGKAQCVFPAAVILNIANQSRHQFSVSFLKICSFSYGHLFLVSIFYQLTSEKNQVLGGDLAYCKQTLKLIKLYVIKNMKGNKGNWPAKFTFPLLSILWSFLLSYSKVYSFSHFIVFYWSVCFLKISTTVPINVRTILNVYSY